MSPLPTAGIPRLPPSAIARRDALATVRVVNRESAVARDARILEAEARLAAAINSAGATDAGEIPSAYSGATTASPRSAAMARNARIREAEATLTALTAKLTTSISDSSLADICAMLRQALVALGGPAYLIRQGEENPRTFLTLIGKLIPAELRAAAQGSDRAGGVMVLTGVPEPDDEDDDAADD